MSKVIVELIKNQDKEFRTQKAIVRCIIRTVLFIVVLSVFVYSLKTRVNIPVFERGLCIFSALYSFTYYYSQIYNDRNSAIMHVLPFSSGQLILFHKIAIMLNCFVKIVIPICCAILGCEIFGGRISVIEALGIFLRIGMLYSFFSSLMLGLIVLVMSKKYVLFALTVIFGAVGSKLMLADMKLIPVLVFTVMAFFGGCFIFDRYGKYKEKKKKSRRAAGSSLMFREIKRFVADRVLFVNQIGMFIFSIIFICNLIHFHISLYFIISTMLIIPLMSTSTGCLYSLENDRIKLIKSLPVDFKKIICYKYMAALVFTLPCYIINAI